MKSESRLDSSSSPTSGGALSPPKREVLRDSPFHAIRHSLRFRLQAWHALFLLIFISAFCLTAWRLALNSRYIRLDAELQRLDRNLMGRIFEIDHDRYLAEIDIAPTPPPANAAARIPFSERLIQLKPEIMSDLRINHLFEGNEPGHASFGIWDDQGNLLIASDNLGASKHALQFHLQSEQSPRYETHEHARQVMRISRGGIRTLVALDTRPDEEELSRYAWLLTASGAGVWILGLLGGWWIAGRALRPIETISKTASRIAEGNLQERILVQETDSELGQLSQTLNQTFDQLHEAVNRQKRFTSDASHELRTPVSIIISESQRALRRPRSQDEYLEVIALCLKTGEKMKHLIDAQLTLAREEGLQLKCEELRPINLAQLACEIIPLLAPLANERNIALITPSQEPQDLFILGDERSMSMAMSNLITNAIQHHRPPSETERLWIRIETAVHDESHAQFMVTDNGPGIPLQEQSLIFERFYRVDPSRSRSEGHFGFGLSIVKAIAERHHGTIRVESPIENGRGSRFILQLPLDSSIPQEIG